MQAKIKKVTTLFQFIPTNFFGYSFTAIDNSTPKNSDSCHSSIVISDFQLSRFPLLGNIVRWTVKQNTSLTSQVSAGNVIRKVSSIWCQLWPSRDRWCSRFIHQETSIYFINVMASAWINISHASEKAPCRILGYTSLNRWYAAPLPYRPTTHHANRRFQDTSRM